MIFIKQKYKKFRYKITNKINNYYTIYLINYLILTQILIVAQILNKIKSHRQIKNIYIKIKNSKWI